MSLITIFNLKPIKQFNPDEIRAAVTESNFHTLCDQYGLDPALIEPAMTHLDIQIPEEASVPFFILRFAPEPAVPIIVNYWRDDERVASYTHTYSSIASEAIRRRLALSTEVFAVDFPHPQNTNLGILFAYELARWLAFRGEGVVYALDGIWYRLNAYKAFLPVI